MTTNTILTTNGKVVLLDRGYSTSSSYSVPSQVQIGQDATTPTISDTALNEAIPINNGTLCDDGDNQFTGTSGGNNSTDNTTTFKPGAGGTDDTAQNLETNATNASKVWTISDITAVGGSAVDMTEYVGFWLYIADAPTLALFASTGTALEVRLGDDAANYRTIVRTQAQLSVGWNWFGSYPNIGTAFYNGGTVGTPTDSSVYFAIIVTTNNASDTWASGSVVYDILHNWTDNEMFIPFQTGYPVIDTAAGEVEYRAIVTSIMANGFLIDNSGVFNSDNPELLTSVDKFTAESKTNTDQFIFVWTDRII